MRKSFRIISLIMIMASICFACLKAPSKEPELSNRVFKIDMPERFANLYDTKVKDSSIDFYDNESISGGNPGWVFGIYSYEEPSEWAGGPIEKVGELTLDNKVYDIVIVYPTESQFGFDREMPEKYKSLYDARYEIASNVTSIDGEKVVIGAGTKGESLYKNELAKHKQSISEKWDEEKLESENMSTIYASIYNDENDDGSSIGYAYKDINLDGIEELLIGQVADGDWGKAILDIYTMVDRKPAHVVSGSDRDEYYALESSLISNEYSDSAFVSGANIYSLTTNSTELFPQIAYKYDEDENSDKPWFIAYNNTNGEWNYDSVDEEKYNEMQDRFSKYADYTFKPIK